MGGLTSKDYLHSSGEQGMVDEAQKALEEAEALKKVSFSLPLSLPSQANFFLGVGSEFSAVVYSASCLQLHARLEPVQESAKYTAADVRIVSANQFAKPSRVFFCYPIC